MNDGVRRASAIGGLLLVMPAAAWTAELLVGTPSLILGAAAVPALLLAAIIVFAQRGGGRALGTLAFSLAWGAVGAAWISTIGNESARRWIDAVTEGDDRALTALLVAPVLEESAKALGLLLLLGGGRLRGARDGIVCGALVGVGFVFAENLLYLGLSMLQGGEAGLLRALHLRGIVGAAPHVVFTACAGAGLGWVAGRAASGRRWVAPSVGMASAIVQHVAWNALAAPAIAHVLCDAPDSGGVCREAPTYAAIFWESGLVALVFLAPGLAGLRAAWRASGTSGGDVPSMRQRPVRSEGKEQGRTVVVRTLSFLAVAFVLFLAMRIAQPLATQVPLSESCWFDFECVKNSCCHAEACAHRLAAPWCRSSYCTMDCRPGTLDCGGRCACREGRCTAQLTHGASFSILPPASTGFGPDVVRQAPVPSWTRRPVLGIY
ncbi:MAG: PrsW family intramembrane metalloprotease [Candidatus Binatia bacterium]